MKSTTTAEAISLVGKRLSDAEGAIAQALNELAFTEDFGEERSHQLPTLGVEATTNLAGRIIAVHLHGPGHEGFVGFPLQFRGITFSSTRRDVAEILGVPARSGTGAQGAWDVFPLQGQTAHFSFDESGRLLLVALDIDALEAGGSS